MSEKKLQAKHLFFQTELNKTQIADILNVSRRTLHYWIREGNWDRLKRSAEHMPALIVENCYHIMAHLTDSLLSERRLTNPPSPKEIDALHKLTLTINKLKSRTALNENIEMFAYFIDKLKARAPEVAESVAPFVEEYLEERASLTACDFRQPHFNDMGYIPMNDTKDYKEQQLDSRDLLAWDTEHYNNTVVPQNPNLQPIPVPEEIDIATLESIQDPIPSLETRYFASDSAASEQKMSSSESVKSRQTLVNKDIKQFPPYKKNLRIINRKHKHRSSLFLKQ